MAVDPISLGFLGLSGYEAYSQAKGGAEAQRVYDEYANEEERQSMAERGIALNEMADITLRGEEAKGRTMAKGAASGLAIGGSIKTATQRIADEVSRRKAGINLKLEESRLRHNLQANQYRKAGRDARKAGRIGAIGSLLTGGFMADRYNWRRGNGSLLNWRGV